MLKKIVSFLMLASVLLTVTGCWDQSEIEELAFVLAVALDPAPPDENKEQLIQPKKLPEHNFTQHFQSTFQIAIPQQATTEGGGGGGGGGNVSEGKAFFNVSAPGMTNFSTVRHAVSRSSRRLNFTHNRVLLINEELARLGVLDHLLDLYVRDHEVRRRTQIFIAKEEAKKILDIQPMLEDLTGMYIERMQQNYESADSMIKPVEVGEVTNQISNQGSYLIPRIVAHGDDQIKIGGAAVIRGLENKMIGWFDEEDIKGYNWIVGEVENEQIEVPYRDEAIFAFEIAGVDTSIDYERKDGQDRFQVHIRTEGYFVENWMHDLELNDQQTINELEQAIVRQIKKEIEHVLDKAQHEIHTDVFGFLNKVRTKEYDYWQEINSSWDGKDGPFSQAQIDVQAEVEIRHYMADERLEHK